MSVKYYICPKCKTLWNTEIISNKFQDDVAYIECNQCKNKDKVQ